MSRKQREIADRHDLFLDIARNILREEGFHLLSMEGLAEAAEYSKGTVYQHFTCKEEILIQVCNSEMAELFELFTRASELAGNSRDRITAVCYSHMLWSRIGNNRTDTQQHLCMHGVLDKVSDSSLTRHKELQNNIIATVNNIVELGIKNGELEKPKQLSTPDIVFGLWSICTGGQLLQASEIPLDEFGIGDPDMAMLRSMILMLDGLNWQPLHNEPQLKKLLKRFNTQTFAQEYIQANANDE